MNATSRVLWVDLKLDVPADEMLHEAQALADRFVPHRSSNSRGWRSLCVHGIGAALTMDARQYGYEKETDAPHRWTEVAESCPVTTKFLKDLPVKQYFRVRFMLLEPFGYILPHQDTKRIGLGPINVALNNPPGCVFRFEREIVPFKAGVAMLLDVSGWHAVFNASPEPRFHMIIHSRFDRKSPFWIDRIRHVL